MISYIGVHETFCPVKLTDKLNGYEPFLRGSNPLRGTDWLKR